MTKTKAYHDVGGDDFGLVPMIDGEYQLWEKRVDAMMRLLSSPDVALMRVGLPSTRLKPVFDLLGQVA
ncbi:MAG: hypothetical protein ACPGSP_08880, partial [Alphaproteobacteria bacterium]